MQVYRRLEIQDCGLAEKPCLEWWLGVFVLEEGKEWSFGRIPQKEGEKHEMEKQYSVSETH